MTLSLQWSKDEIDFYNGPGAFLSTTAIASCSDSGTQAIAINRASPASWLTVSPSTDNAAPGTFTFTASLTGLAPGLYTETVQIIDNGATPAYATASIMVTLNVATLGSNGNLLEGTITPPNYPDPKAANVNFGDFDKHATGQIQ